MELYSWDPDKNERLKVERGISFEEIVLHIERGDVLKVFEHPNKERYPNQQVLVVNVNNYAYLVPFVESERGRFLKTIIPSRKATRDFIGAQDEET